MKVEDPMAERARAIGTKAALAMLISFTLAGAWLAFGIDGFAISGDVVTDGPSNPLLKQVETASWMSNYSQWPLMLLAPVGTYLFAALTWLLLRANRGGLGFLTSSVTVAGVILTAGLSLFPFLMPSKTPV